MAEVAVVVGRDEIRGGEHLLHRRVEAPGVPGEMERMWANEARPELERRSSGEVLVTRPLITLALGFGLIAAIFAAYAANPERFVNGPPRIQPLPTEVWINAPVNTTTRPTRET